MPDPLIDREIDDDPDELLEYVCELFTDSPVIAANERAATTPTEGRAPDPSGAALEQQSTTTEDDQGPNDVDARLPEIGVARTSGTRIIARRQPAVESPRLEDLYGPHVSEAVIKEQLTATTRKKIIPALQHWRDFCTFSNQDPAFHADGNGLKLYATDPGDNAAAYNVNLILEFFRYLTTRVPALTKTAVGNAKIFINTHLKLEFASLCVRNGRPLRIPEEISVGKMRMVQSAISSFCGSQAQNERDECHDVLGTVDIDMTEEVELAALHSYLKLVRRVPGVQPPTPLMRALTLAIWTRQRADGRRGNESRSHRLCEVFMRPYKVLGKCRARCTLTIDGKTNSVGKKEFTGTIPHVIPILDSAAWNGLYLLMRHEVSGVAPPNYTNYEDLLPRLAYPAPGSETSVLSYTTHSGGYKYIIQLAEGEAEAVGEDINITKVTHRNRLKQIQACDERNVSFEQISRNSSHAVAGNNQSQAQRDSYLYQPAVSVLLTGAGADPNFPKSYLPCWNQHPVPNELIDLLRPGFRSQIQQLQALRSQLNPGEKRDQRIMTCLLSAKACLHDLQSVLHFLACRPVVERDDVLVLEHDKESYFQFLSLCHGFNQFLSLPVFHSNVWRQFHDDNLRAQIEHHQRLRSGSSSPLTNPSSLRPLLDDFWRQFRQYMDPVMLQLAASQGGTLSATHRIPASPPFPAEAAPDEPTDVVFEAAAAAISRPALSDDTLVNGERRKRRRAVSQVDSAHYVSQVRRVLGEAPLTATSEDACPFPDSLSDDQCKSFRDLLRRYSLYEEYEKLYGSRWRNDLFQGDRAKSTWWSNRKLFYELIRIKLDELNDEEATFVWMEEHYHSIPIAPPRKEPRKNDVWKHFKSVHYLVTGVRPKAGRKGGTPQNARAVWASSAEQLRRVTPQARAGRRPATTCLRALGSSASGITAVQLARPLAERRLQDRLQQQQRTEQAMVDSNTPDTPEAQEQRRSR